MLQKNEFFTLSMNCCFFRFKSIQSECVTVRDFKTVQWLPLLLSLFFCYSVSICEKVTVLLFRFCSDGGNFSSLFSFFIVSANHLVILITIQNTENPIKIQEAMLATLLFCSCVVLFCYYMGCVRFFLIFITLKSGTCIQNETKHQKQKWVWILFSGSIIDGKQYCLFVSKVTWLSYRTKL